MRITLPDGSIKEFDQQVTGAQVAQSIGPGLARAAIGVKINGQLADLNLTIDEDVDLEIITKPSTNKSGKAKGPPNPDAMYLVRHSCAHVMAEAIQRLWPQAQLAYGPPVEGGFYYDIALDEPISSDDFARIETEMQSIVEEDRPFTRYELSPPKGMDKLEAEKSKYKIDNARRALDGGAATLSWYVTGATENAGGQSSVWEDLCMGPHIPSTGVIGAFKIMSVATSYWHGDIQSDRFQRVHGTAFFSQADLALHLEQLEQAKHRDHRVIGQKLALFTIDEQVGQGLILWKPRGAAIRQQLQDFISRHLAEQGYQQVFTPHIGKLDLYKRSGHYPYYQDSQYAPIINADQISQLAQEGASCSDLANRIQQGEIDGYLLKPMNCPHHIRIFDSEKHSYRDLPIRLAEFGTVYRWEQSGEISGMTRVRGLTQDDAHLFCTEDQLRAELLGCLDLVKIIFKTLNMTDYRVRVGLRDPDSSKYVGEAESWNKAEQACREAAESLGVPYSLASGEAAFYGPKIDFLVHDVLGRQWQLGTVQVDYNLPKRFDLSYTGPDNQQHRPVMIHRAPFGSMERFIGVLIEHFAGAFPLWLAPEQIRILPVGDKFADYACKVCQTLQSANIRVTVDNSNERLNAKIRIAEDLKVPYMLVVGGRDEQGGTVSVRARGRGDLGPMPLDAFVDKVSEEMRTFGQSQVKAS